MNSPLKLEEKKRDLGLHGLWYLLFEPIINDLRPTVITIIENKSFQPLMNFLRYACFLLQPNAICFCCGSIVKKRWIPILPCHVDPGVKESLRPLESARVTCGTCDPFLRGLEEEEKRRTFYIV